MNSALKPVLSASGPQNPPVTSQINKSMHPQGPPTSYGQPSSHMPQSLVNLPHNTNAAHNAAQNHYSLNVPNASQHYMSNPNTSSIPISNHPVANVSQSSGQAYNPPKNVSYSSGYQPNLGHPPNQNTLPPVSQTLPATSTPVQPPSQNSSVSSDSSAEKPQSNGTSELKPASVAATKPEPTTGNHISPSKDNKTSTTPVPPPADKSPAEKPKPATPDQKPPPEPAKVFDEINVPTTPVAATANVVIESASSTSAPKPAPITAPLAEKTEKSSVVSAPTAAAVTVEKTPLVSGDGSESSSSGSQEEPASKTTSEENEAEAATTPTKSKEPSPQKASSSLKLATTPRTPARKSKQPKVELESPSPKSSKSESKSTSVQKSPSAGKVKRQRIKTQPYQSPLPELEIITKISSSTPRSKNNDEKLIVFYKNEFLAVRNSEGTFYVCQAVQNIFKSSTKIKIRWLSQDKNDKSGEIYTPDFYDLTDFDCILTNLNLNRVDKGKFRLPAAEKERTDSILKRSLAVEKGEEVTSPSLTEEHPDGLDLSLYTEESQLNKRKGTKRKASTRGRKAKIAKKSPEPKVQKVVPKAVKKPAKKAVVLAVKKTLAAVVEAKKPATSSSSRAGRAKRRSDVTKSSSPVMDQKKAKVLAKVARKTAVPTSKTQATSKNVKVSKPTPSSSKTVKSPKVQVLRRAQRASRK